MAQFHQGQSAAEMLRAGSGGLDAQLLFRLGDALRPTIALADVADLLDGRARALQALDVAAVVRGDQGEVAGPEVGGETEQLENLFDRCWSIFASCRAVMIDEREAIAGELLRKVVDQLDEHDRSRLFKGLLDFESVLGRPGSPGKAPIVNNHVASSGKQLRDFDHLEISSAEKNVPCLHAVTYPVKKERIAE